MGNLFGLLLCFGCLMISTADSDNESRSGRNFLQQAFAHKFLIEFRTNWEGKKGCRQFREDTQTFFTLSALSNWLHFASAINLIVDCSSTLKRRNGDDLWVRLASGYGTLIFDFAMSVSKARRKTQSRNWRIHSTRKLLVDGKWTKTRFRQMNFEFVVLAKVLRCQQMSELGRMHFHFLTLAWNIHQSVLICFNCSWIRKSF